MTAPYVNVALAFGALLEDCNISCLKSKFDMHAGFVVMFLPSKVSGYCQHVFELEVAISISSQNSRDR